MKQKQIKIDCTILGVQSTRFGISFETDTEFSGFDENGEAVDKANFLWSPTRVAKEWAKVDLTFAKFLTRSKSMCFTPCYVDFLDFCLKGAKIKIIRTFVPAGTEADDEVDHWSTSLSACSNLTELLQAICNPLNSLRLNGFNDKFAAIERAANDNPKLDITNV